MFNLEDHCHLHLLGLANILDEYISLKGQKVTVDQEKRRVEMALQGLQSVMQAYQSGGVIMPLLLPSSPQFTATPNATFDPVTNPSDGSSPDFAILIVDLKKNLTAEKSPVVVFGGSYGGMLAAWFRLKYPHITIGALASSAPILQFDDIISSYSFNNIITKDFRGESENCYQVIKNSWKEFDNVLTQESIDKLAESFKICKGVPRDANLPDMIVDWIQNAPVYVAMTDYPTPSDFLASLPAYSVKKGLIRSLYYL